ncbi:MULTISPECIES: NUDIX domain-containing protein [Rhizobium]|uniref:8-oxo-dGTP diphosphatase n=1 Tax=Rhizobium tropici TaxID=398 RepID=A0A6P1C1V1_RHITR|nr:MULTISPECIES: NUDIX domain-containing protein [Rhizobium]AGB71323.1 nudix hydrolase [Rhizobium tropici CIAT 899]MBB4240317.1 8-oxo-dGTP diphosphatase [Rhizobium tropici]MBB5591587.1 8-oxo-dGTP diphosphatase [Rhizobium tropici]MBB6490329.1 8-oxo-dGTP diphosphatase [Rhizobium tropici]NEV11180.1 NUDIX domain-containing protein [Rhizobium tropici]
MGKPGIDFPGLGTGLAILRDGKLLLYRRLKAPEAGCWSIVGGKVDYMEPAASAAVREAEEESGLSIGEIDYLCTEEVIIEADRQHWISLIYICRDFSGEPRLMEPDKLSDFGWFGRNELPAQLSEFAKATIAHLSEEDFR